MIIAREGMALIGERGPNGWTADEVAPLLMQLEPSDQARFDRRAARVWDQAQEVEVIAQALGL